MISIFSKFNKRITIAINKFHLLRLTLLFGKKISIKNVWLGKKFELDVESKDFKIWFKENVHFRKRSTICIRGNGRLIIGANTFFNNGISINCHNSIEIGADCLFGEDVKIYDHNHRFRDKKIPIAKQGYSIGLISIGNNCWIGSNVVILKNVVIGNDVVIGANCVIFENIPSNTIVKTKNTLEYIVY